MQQLSLLETASTNDTNETDEIVIPLAVTIEMDVRSQINIKIVMIEDTIR